LVLDRDPVDPDQARIRSLNGTMESVSFNVPSESLTIRMGTGDDTLTMNEFDFGLGTALSVLGQGDYDTIAVAGAAVVSTRQIAGADSFGDPSTGDSGALAFTAETIDLNAGSALLSFADSGFS